MASIKFYVELGASNEHLDTLINVLSAMKSDAKKLKGASISEALSDEAKKVKQIEAKEAAPTAPAPEKEETKAETTKGAKGVTLDMIREVVAEKRKDHLAEMKAQLKDVHGVDNINKLAEKDYVDFYNYIKSL